MPAVHAISSEIRSSLFTTIAIRTMLILATLTLTTTAPAQLPAWAWIGGTPTPAFQYHMEAVGVPHPDNSPGRRDGAATWLDSDGNLWQFGGDLYDAQDYSETSDIWMFDRTLSQWVCQHESSPAIIGIYDPGDDSERELHPGARHHSAAWLADDGAIWIFGGIGFDKTGPQAALNDLWQYDPTTQKWSWVHGSDTSSAPGVYGTRETPAPLNTPGARSDAHYWKDSDGNLWLYGGSGYATGNTFGTLNDLWKFDTTTRQWTWMNGDTTVDAPGEKGTQGTPAPENTPPANVRPALWVDGNTVWLYGGSIYKDWQTNMSNNLWKYDMTTNQWAWLQGTDELRSMPVYGDLGVAHPDNTPGGRRGSVNTINAADGTLWLYAASYPDDDAFTEPGGDWWKLDTATLQWTWMGGPQAGTFQSPAFGTLGVSHPDNFPGIRENSTFWSDTAGNLWLFGGDIYLDASSFQQTSDLWHFSATSNHWTWIQGPNFQYSPGRYGTLNTPDPANIPGARREALALTASDNTLWLFGGWGLDSNGDEGFLNDLWQFNPATNQWTWKKGSETVNDPGLYGVLQSPHALNSPPARRDMAGWIDNDGNIWVFGGETYRSLSGDRWDDILRSDLWKYDPTTGNWTWMHGGRLNQDPAVFGELGEFGPDNIPGAREGAATWIDADGNFWLFGGWGTTDENSSPQRLNDLWKFNPILNQWAWIGGTKLKNQRGTNGTQGTPSTTNIPGAREDAATWTDTDGNFWLFGGEGYGETGFSDWINDLWRLNPTTLEWTWIHGPNTSNEGAEFGTLGVPHPDNRPGSRSNAASWVDANGNLNLYGGHGIHTFNGFHVHMADLWTFDIALGQWIWTGGSDQRVRYSVNGPLFESSTAYTPGGRHSAAFWSLNNTLVLLGGEADILKLNNDLWLLGDAPPPPTAATDWQLFN